MGAKYNYFDIVRIRTNHPEKRQWNDVEGFVIGISEPINGGEPNYAIHIEGEKYGWDFSESELENTGRRHETPFYLEEPGAAEVTIKPKPHEPILLTPQQLLHGIDLALLEAGIQDKALASKVIQAVASLFDLDKTYVRLFLKTHTKRDIKTGGRKKTGQEE